MYETFKVLPRFWQHLSACVVVAMSVIGSPVGNDDAPRTVEDYRDEAGVAGISHRPLSGERLGWWADVLQVSDAQRHFMDIMYAQFVERHNAFLDREAPMYLAMGVELNQFVTADDFATRLYAEELRGYNQATMRIRQTLTRYEHDLINLIQPVLTEKQQERLIILRNDAIRRNWRTDDNYVRWLDVELRDIWGNSEAIDRATPEERTKVERILLDYELRLTLLIRSHAIALPRIYEKQVAIMRAYAEGSISAREQINRIRRLYQDGGDDARRIRLLHEATLEQISAEISRSPASTFATDVKRAVFPELYPDQSSIGLLLTALLKDDALNEQQRTDIELLHAEYEFDYKRISRELEDTCVEWGQRAFEGALGYDPPFLPEALEPLLEQRRALSRKYLTILLDNLGADVLEAHIDLIPAGLAEVAETDSPTAIPEPEPDR